MPFEYAATAAVNIALTPHNLFGFTLRAGSTSPNADSVAASVPLAAAKAPKAPAALTNVRRVKFGIFSSITALLALAEAQRMKFPSALHPALFSHMT